MSDSIPVHIIFVLDRSGSMEPIRADVIGGFNQFLAEQQAQPGKCRMTLVQFDSQEPYEVLADGPIADVKPLDLTTYIPRGGTPLIDAEAKAILAGKAREQARQSAKKKAEAVLFVTYTDGQENASREYSLADLTTMKKEREEAGWTFLYLGAGADAYAREAMYAQSASIGTRSTNTSATSHTSAGHRKSMATASAVASGYRQAAYSGNDVALASASTDAYGTFGVRKADEDEVDEVEAEPVNTGKPQGLNPKRLP